ncbi:glycosyltransferase family 2 protein [Shimazuella kribbensis]|uniref:glycosyltransferase family 2 protein n=1 Tax=Shimazuella kribbensis TaxID=139808 RepID=UPI001470D184|nr:glycosyltransferase [Shimazuella kribbensis]
MFEIHALGIIISLLYVLPRAVRSLLRVSYANRWLDNLATMNSHKTKKNVVVIVCCYKRVHLKCLQSIVSQVYAGKLTVYVVDDGSPNFEELEEKYYQKIVDRPNWKLIPKKRVAGTNGKKKAQQTALEQHQNWKEDDLILFLDADTYLDDPFLVQRLADAHSDDHVGAVSAQLGVANLHASWITKYLGEEYRQTFLKSKAAESQHDMVKVINGACGMWKWSTIQKVYDRYLQGPATGDENTLTWEVLKDGYHTIMVPTIANTEVPETFRDLIIQQVRWLRSDCLYTLKNYRLLSSRKKGYLLFDMTVELFTPMLLLFVATSCVWHLVTGAGFLTLIYVLPLLIMVLIDTAMTWGFAAKSRGMVSLSFAFKSACFVGINGLIWLWALLTCKRDVWITR